MPGARWTLSADSSKAVKGTKDAADGFGRLETQQKSNVTTGMKLSAAMAGINQALEIGKKILGATERLWDSSAGKVLTLSRNVSELGDNLAKNAGSLNESAQTIQNWRSAAELAGTEASRFDRSLLRAQRSALDADRGLSTAVDLFDRVGISVHRANGELKSGTEILSDMADAYASGLVPETEKAAIASQLLGDRTGRITILLNQGSDAITANADRLREWGTLMSDELLAASEEYADSVQRRQEAEQGYANAVAEETLPAMADLNNRFALLIANLSQSRDDVRTWSSAFADGLTWVAEVAVIMGVTFDTMMSEMTIDILKMERAFLEMLQRLAPHSIKIADELARVHGRISGLQDDLMQKKNAMAGFLKGTGLEGLVGGGGGGGDGGGGLGDTPIDEIEIEDAGGEGVLQAAEQNRALTSDAKDDTEGIGDAWGYVAGQMGGVVSGFDTLIGKETAFLKGLGSIIQKIQALQAVIAGIQSIGKFFGSLSGVTLPGGGIGDRGLMPTVLADRGAGTLPGGGSHSLVIRRNDEVVMDPEGTGALTRMLKSFEGAFFGGGPASGFDPSIGGGNVARIMLNAPIVLANGTEIARLVLDEAVELTNAGQGPLSGLAMEDGR